MSDTDPVLVIIPGATCPVDPYLPLARHFRGLGYDVYVLPLQSVGRLPVRKGGFGPGLYDDAAFVAKHVATLVEEGREVVMLGHSYGGMVMTQSLQGLTTQERTDKGLPGGVIRLVYMTAYAPQLGENMSDYLMMPGVPINGTPMQDPYMFNDASISGPWIFNDMDSAAAVKVAECLQEESWLYATQPITWAGYKYVPSTYMLATKDQVIKLEVQQKQIENLRQNAPLSKTGKQLMPDVIEVNAGHGPNVTAFNEVAAILQSVLSGTR